MGKPLGEITHWRNKNVEDLPRQPKYTNPYPWGDPYKGGGLRPPPQRGAAFGSPLCGFLYMGLPMGTGSCIWAAWAGLPHFYCADV